MFSETVSTRARTMAASSSCEVSRLTICDRRVRARARSLIIRAEATREDSLWRLRVARVVYASHIKARSPKIQPAKLDKEIIVFVAHSTTAITIAQRANPETRMRAGGAESL